MLLVLVIISFVALALTFSKGRNAIWGGATIGLILGVIVGIFRSPFFTTLGYGFVIGTFAGIAAELLGRISDYLKRKG